MNDDSWGAKSLPMWSSRIKNSSSEELHILKGSVLDAEEKGHFPRVFSQVLLDQIRDVEAGDRKPEWEE